MRDAVPERWGNPLLRWGVASLTVTAILAGLWRLAQGQQTLLSRGVAVYKFGDSDKEKSYQWLSDHELLMCEHRHGWCLARLDLTTGVGTPLIGAAQGLPLRNDTPANMSVSPDGRWLLWRDWAKRELVVVRLDGSRRYAWDDSANLSGAVNLGLPRWQNSSRNFVEMLTLHADNAYRTPYTGAALIRDIDAPGRAEVVDVPRYSEFEPNPYFDPPYVTGDGMVFSVGGDSGRSVAKTLLFVPLRSGGPPRTFRVHAPPGLEFAAPSFSNDSALALSPQGDRVAWLCVSPPTLPPLLALLRRLIPSLTKARPHRTFSIWISRPDGGEMRELGAIETVCNDDELRDAGIENLCWLAPGKYLGFAYQHTLYRVPVN